MAKDKQYNQIIQLWKNERRTTDLLEVNAGMYSTIRQKITSFEKELENLATEDKISKIIISERVDRLNRILRDLTKLRMHKIIHGILGGTLTNKGLAAEELDLVRGFNRLNEEHTKRSIFGETSIDIAANGTVEKSKSSLENQINFMTVRILEDIPAIVDAAKKGAETRAFGPYKKEDIVKLPLVYAKALIMKNAADRVDLPDL